MTLIEEGAIIAGRYRLERTLARGGMGSVWRARHLDLDAAVAIKFIAPEYASSADARARFEREAKVSAQLRTPHVVQVYDYGVEDGTPFIAMELLDGEDLGARLAREGRLAPAAVVVLVTPLCKALRRAHEAGLVHRDLKPANIFLARQGDEEIVKILDFGIAKVTGIGIAGNATKTGTLLGSPYYMSPEQVRRSKEVDYRSDLWSLGVIIFQCLTGRLPFQAEELGELILQICSLDLPLASHFAPDLGGAMDRFLTRALARDPGERFQSAQELAAALAEAVSNARARIPRSPIPGSAEAAARPPSLPTAPTELALPDLPAPPARVTTTLSPSGASFVVLPPGHSRRVGVLLALLASALLLGLIAFTALRAHGPRGAPIPRLGEGADTAAAPLSATATATAMPPASSAAVPAPAVTPSASAVAPPKESASAGAPTPRRRAPKPGPISDPTDHM